MWYSVVWCHVVLFSGVVDCRSVNRVVSGSSVVVWWFSSSVISEKKVKLTV